MNMNDSFRISKNVMSRQVGNETVILDLETGIYFGLDAVGVAIWELLSKGNSLQRICDDLVAIYDVTPQQLAADVSKLARQLQEKRLISPA